MKHSEDVFFWSLFSAGGMAAALLCPALMVVLGLAIPLGWVEAPSYGDLIARLGHPVARVAIFALISLSTFHWAHRFRYTLYDGLQLYHLYGLIATLCYGGAGLLTLASAYWVWSLP